MLLLVLSCLSWIKYFVTAPSIRNKYNATWLGCTGWWQQVMVSTGTAVMHTHTHPALEAPAKSLNMPIGFSEFADPHCTVHLGDVHPVKDEHQ